MQIDTTSTPEDLIAKDAAAVELELLDHAQAMLTTPTDKPTFDNQEVAAAIESYTAEPSSSSPLARKRLRNLRVEVPLTPQYHTGSTSEQEPSAKKAKKMQFNLEAASLLPDVQAESSDTLPEFTKQHMDDFQDTVARAAESVQQQLQSEQLIEIDTIMRVKIPNLDAVQIQPPWYPDFDSEKECKQLQSRQVMMQDVSKDLLTDTRKWGGVAKIERSLQWAPFASYLAKVDMSEQFDDGSLERYLTDMDLDDGTGEVDVHTMVAKSPGPSLLPSHDSDDEEIEPVVTEEDSFGDEAPGDNKPAPEVPTAPPSIRPDFLDVLRAKQRDLARSADTDATKPALEAAVPSGINSGANSGLMQNDGIAQFMQLRGRTIGVQKSSDDAGHKTKDALAQSAARNQAPAAVMVPRIEALHAQARPHMVISVPVPLDNSKATIPIIVSSNTMANRQLIRRIRTTLPNIEMHERDATITAVTQHSSGVHREADFTISASTGAMTTTLQKLKQRPLPGQMSTSGIRENIATTAIRYGRLLVLVSEGNNVATEEGAMARTLDQLDCEALVDLTNWVHTLDSDVQVSYVAGGEQELAGWLAAAFTHHGSKDGGVRLLQDETMWERWLRVAGLNAYAAQQVLVQLKVPDNDTHDPSALKAQRRFGVAAFVSMTAEERVQRFGSVLGGERVLRRVSEAIDGGWIAKSG